MTAAATQTALDVTAIEDTLESTLSAFDSNQAVKLALEQRVAELEGQLANLTQNADASTQTELDVDGFFGLEDGLLEAALGWKQHTEERKQQVLCQHYNTDGWMPFELLCLLQGLHFLRVTFSIHTRCQ